MGIVQFPLSSSSIPKADDCSEALRLCRAHRDRLLSEATALETRARIAERDMREQLAANRDLRQANEILRSKLAEYEDADWEETIQRCTE